MSYPEFGSFESGGPCPASHPVRMGQLFYEVIWVQDIPRRTVSEGIY